MDGNRLWLEWLKHVYFSDVPGTIAVNHSLGDLYYDKAVSKKAHIKEHPVGKIDPGERVFFLLTSDGALKHTSLDEHATALLSMLQKDPNISLSAAAKQLTDNEISKHTQGHSDNVTIGLVEYKGQSVMMWVFDGHGGKRTSTAAVGLTRDILEKAKTQGWVEAFDGLPTTIIPQALSEREETYHQTWKTLPEDVQKLCFPHLQMAEDYHRVCNRFKNGQVLNKGSGGNIIETAAKHQQMTSEQLVMQTLTTLKERGYDRMYTCTKTLDAIIDLTANVSIDVLAERLRGVTDQIDALANARRSAQLDGNNPNLPTYRS